MSIQSITMNSLFLKLPLRYWKDLIWLNRGLFQNKNPNLSAASPTVSKFWKDINNKYEILTGWAIWETYLVFNVNPIIDHHIAIDPYLFVIID